MKARASTGTESLSDERLECACLTEDEAITKRDLQAQRYQEQEMQSPNELQGLYMIYDLSLFANAVAR